MRLITENENVEQFFLPWRFPLGSAYDAYKGHVYRVLNFTSAILEQHGDDLADYGKIQEVEDRVAVAACFHDVGIWLNKTMHYLDPSKEHATKWLEEHGRSEWDAEVALMIEFHHKMSLYRG